MPAPALAALVTPVGSCTTATLTASVAGLNGGCAVPSHFALAERRLPGRPEGVLTLGLLKQSNESMMSMLCTTTCATHSTRGTHTPAQFPMAFCTPGPSGFTEP